MSDEFFDALSDNPDLEYLTSDAVDTDLEKPIESTSGKKNLSHKKCSSDFIGKKTASRRSYRTRIADRPPVKLSLWNFIKNAIGKDLSKIPMPVNFNEPLSMLQRVTECLQFSSLLDKASKSDDTLMQMSYVAAFAVSCYSETAQRVNKPFNPLLNETFEFDRSTDMGWRSICEQVTHHPPACALFAEGKDWEYGETFAVVSKFRGKYLMVDPLGLASIKFKDGNNYSWNKVETTVNNIIIGNLSIEQSGNMEVLNHKTGEQCTIKFHSSSIFSSKSKRRITGTIYDSDGNPRFAVEGFWDKFIEFLKITAVVGKDVYETGFPSRLWSINPINEESSKYYNFTEFTCSLNQEQDSVAPTDSRNRPDQRALEEGDFETADKLKVKLEEKQRARRKAALEEIIKQDSNFSNDHGEVIKPVWFEVDEETSLRCRTKIYKYKGGYWESKLKSQWGACPSLFDI